MIDSPPRISVIIPTHGRISLLSEALESVAKQTFKPYEVIVVDDCSPTPVTIPDSLNLPIRLIRHLRNQGQGAARNTGLAHATGDWVLFLDDDDVLADRRLEMAVEDMAEARCHACAVEYVFPDGETAPGKVLQGDLRNSFLDGTDPGGRHPDMGQVVHRREDLLQFDPTLRRSQDTEWWLRLSDKAIFAWTNEIGLRVRVHPQLRPYSSSRERLAVRAQIARRHGPTSSPTRRAHLYGQVAGAALSAGCRGTAALWAVRAMLAKPSTINAKRLVLTLKPPVKPELGQPSAQRGRGGSR